MNKKIVQKILVGLGVFLYASMVYAHPHHTLVQQTTRAQARETRETATGVVFNDQNRNLERDEGEPGIPDVSVSNGLEVVQTDAEGRYSLPVSEETIIFITKPAEYMVPVNEVQLPQFYYLHYPNGTPVDLEFGGIEPTGPLPESVDFPLLEQTLQDSFNAIAFADPQAADNTDLSFFRDDIIAELVGVDALFGLTAGDVVDDDLSLYERHNELVSMIGLPWWNVPGNHDVNFDAPDDRHATDTFKRVFGPTYYSYDYGQVHFVGLDNVDYAGAEERGYRGYISEEQITWLRNDLAFVPEDKLIVIVTHIPLMTDAVDRTDALITVNLPELLDALEGREHVYTLSGHDTSNSWQMYLDHEHGWNGPTPLHHQVLAEVRGDGWGGPKNEHGIPETTMQDGNPNGYYILSFDGNQYQTRFKAAGESENYQMRIMLEQEGAGRNQLSIDQWEVEAWQTPQLVVNVFDGGEQHVVEYRVNDGDFSPMEHVLRTDPYMEDRYFKYLDTESEVGRPAMSSHIWVADMPTNLAAGVHTVTVRSTDPYGQVAEDSQVFEVLE
jgi:hypothetical protein